MVLGSSQHSFKVWRKPSSENGREPGEFHRWNCTAEVAGVGTPGVRGLWCCLVTLVLLHVLPASWQGAQLLGELVIAGKLLSQLCFFVMLVFIFEVWEGMCWDARLAGPQFLDQELNPGSVQIVCKRHSLGLQPVFWNIPAPGASKLLQCCRLFLRASAWKVERLVKSSQGS